MATTLERNLARASAMAKDRMPRIGLADALAELRAEISRARREGEGKDVRFAATSIEVELFVEFTAEGLAEVGVPTWVPLDLAAEGRAQRGTGHRIRIVMEIDPGGAPSDRLIADEMGPAPVRPETRE